MAAILTSAPIRELRARLEGRDLQPYRFADGAELRWGASPAGTDAALQRFLLARKGDPAKAEAMFAAHLTWRRRVFPIARDGAVGEVLRDGSRFARVGASQDGVPVLMINFMWGYFLEGVSAADCLRATLLFMEDEIAIAEQEGHHQAYIVSYGGPPPLDFAAALAAFLDANYPERLARAVIYPVPRVVARMARAMLWILDAGTAAKVTIHWEEGEFLKHLRLVPEQLPPVLRGGLQGAVQQFKPDSRSRMNGLIRAGALGCSTAAAQLQQQLVHPREAPQLQRRAFPPPPKKQRAAQPQSLWSCCCGAREDDAPSSPGYELNPPNFSTCAPQDVEATMPKATGALGAWIPRRRHLAFASSSALLMLLIMLLGGSRESMEAAKELLLR